MRRREFTAGLAGLFMGAGGMTRGKTASGAEPDPARVRGVPGPFRVIDVHAHTLNTKAPNLTETARKTHGDKDGTIESLIRAMDEGGVDHAFLLTYSAEDLAAELRWKKVNPVEFKPKVNRAYQIRAWRAHRDRFWLFVNHSNPLRETFLEDLERDLDQGAAGWKFMPIFYGFLADHPGFLPAYELCRRRGVPIILDLSNWYMGKYPMYNELPERQNLVRSFKDYARLLDPLFSEFATVPICLAHLGTPGRGFERITEQDRDYADIFALVRRHPNVLLDTSPRMVRTPEFYRRIIDSVGARKLMWGSDWISLSSDMTTWRMIQDQCDFLSEAEKALILSGNALRFVQGKV